MLVSSFFTPGVADQRAALEQHSPERFFEADWAQKVPEHVETSDKRTARILTMPTLSKGAADRIREIGE